MSKAGPLIIIDDDKDEQLFCPHVLRSLNLKNTIYFFNNGKEALEYLVKTKETPFLILCDMRMPVMDGLELRKQIFNNPYLRKKSTPFVFLTGTATEEDVKESYELTVQGFFEKTSDIRELEDQLSLIIKYWEHCLEPNNRI